MRQAQAFQCGYHGWTYALDGRLLGTPEFDNVACFTKDAKQLPEFRVEVWGGLVFVKSIVIRRRSKKRSETYLRDCNLNNLARTRLAARKDWYIDCNWKSMS